MLAEYHGHWQPHPRIPFHRITEDRSLRDGQPDVEANDHKERARQEGNSPPEIEELLVGQPGRQQQEDAARAQEAKRGAELREHAIPRALSRWRVLHGQKDRASPFPTQTEPLAEAAQCEKQRSRETDGLVGRQRPNQHGGHSHREKRGDEGDLSADSIAEVTEQRRSDRSRNKRNAERGERRQGRRGGVARRKEQPWKHQDGGGGVDVEVEKLNRRSDETGRQNLSGRIDRRATE